MWRCNAVALGILLSSAAQADSMRCGTWVVNESVSVAELVQKCGEPKEKSAKTEDITTVNRYGAVIRTGATTTRETWIYQRDATVLPMQIIIVDGKIMSISRAD